MSLENDLLGRYGACCRVLGFERWNTVVREFLSPANEIDFPEFLDEREQTLHLPPFLAELAGLERTYREVRLDPADLSAPIDSIVLNPSIQLVHLGWKNLATLSAPERYAKISPPVEGEEFVLIWKDPATLVTRIRPAKSQELLVIKMVSEGIDRQSAAIEGNIPIGEIDAAFENARRSGLVLVPQSKLIRPDRQFSSLDNLDPDRLTAKVFTLQWHITQLCDLHCKHCYDRSKRSPLKLNQGFAVLDQLREFVLSRNVRGQVTFTGGNPFLFPHFFNLYQGAADRGFNLAVLGNPTSEEQIRQLINIRKPLFFQVSLEGLPSHNDLIRGNDHFQRTMDFLALLKKLEVSSMVMLTLTDENIDQVIPLAEYLRDKVDDFFFNRLSQVGEGAGLTLPSPEKYERFLDAYITAARDNRVMGLKDNLMNVSQLKNNRKIFGGCCGFGCGAAFNFFSALPDGEVHACRKFPSPIGNLYKQTVSEIYDSPEAERYRRGCRECAECRLKPVCGGCLAVSYSHGQDVFVRKDPFCFIE